MPVLEVTFIASLLVIIYAYVGYPLLILVRGLCWVCPYVKTSVTPRITLVICCHNEERGIEAKIRNLFELDYPQDRLEIVIASDGSTDATEEIIDRVAGTRVKLLSLSRRGKAAALNAAVKDTTGEILVFSDANSMYAADAVRNLVRPFADPRIGGVAGNQVYRNSYNAGTTAAGEVGYWNFDRWMKTLQSRSGNTISATGAIYAIRRDLFRSVPAGVTDDFVTSTRVIEQGFRLVFEPDAVCYEPVAGAPRAEFGRKSRVITRGLYGVGVVSSLLNPFRHGFYAVQLFSHKVLRRLVVLPGIMIAVVSPLLWQEGLFYQVATIGQGLFYGAALCGWLWGRTGRRAPRLIALPFYFCMVNAAVLVALSNVCQGRRIALWDPHRGASSPAESHTDGRLKQLPGWRKAATP